MNITADELIEKAEAVLEKRSALAEERDALAVDIKLTSTQKDSRAKALDKEIRGIPSQGPEPLRTPRLYASPRVQP